MIRLAMVVLLPLLLALAPAMAQNVVFIGDTTTLKVEGLPDHQYKWELYNTGTVNFAEVQGNCPVTSATFVGSDSEASVRVKWLEAGTYFYKVTARDATACAMNLKVGMIRIIYPFNVDFDSDDIPDIGDDDADGDGILNVYEAPTGEDWVSFDSDGDGHPNWLDIDADNDGIVDHYEAQATIGYIPPSGKVNANGVDQAYDPGSGGTLIIPADTDGGGIADFLDNDSDQDGVPDYIEGHDSNFNGKPDHTGKGKDSDEDGLDDEFDTVDRYITLVDNNRGSNASMQDFDMDGMKDWRDDNDDNDKYPTLDEDMNMDKDFSNDDFGHPGQPEYLYIGRDCDLFIPNAFSPNGDNVHDYFQIYCIDQYPDAKMYIFDQMGNTLFEKEHYGNLEFWGTAEEAWWDGSTTNRSALVDGDKVTSGTYYYVFKLGNGITKKSFVFVSH